MDIKVPKNMKSPTVIIVGGQDDEKKNAYHEKRLDLLESKLDQQYKAFIDKTDNTKTIDLLQKSFISTLDRFMSMNKSMMSDMHKQKIDILRDEFNKKIKSLENDDDKDEVVEEISSKLDSLVNAMAKMSKPVVINQGSPTRPISHDYLSKSFDILFKRLEDTIMKARPRMIPYVS